MHWRREITFERCFLLFIEYRAMELFCVINSNYLHQKVVQMIAALTLNMLIVFQSSIDFLSAALKLFLFDDYIVYVCVCVHSKETVYNWKYTLNEMHWTECRLSMLVFKKHNQFNFMAEIAFKSVWGKKNWE